MRKVLKFVKGKRDDKKDVSPFAEEPACQIGQASAHEDEANANLEHGCGYKIDVSGKDKSISKLHKAAWQGNLEKLKVNTRKIDIDITDKLNRTPLHLAAAQGHTNIVWFLLSNKAKMNICDNEGKTPFLKAIECGNKDAVHLMLERGVDLNTIDYSGNSGLHTAAKQGYYEIASVLLKQGANFENSNNVGESPLHIATQAEHRDLVELLLRYGSSVNVVDRDNRSPLMFAAKRGSMVLVQLFLEYGAQRKVMDSNDWTAEDYALLGGHHDVAAELKSLSDVLEMPFGAERSEDERESFRLSVKRSVSATSLPPGPSTNRKEESEVSDKKADDSDTWNDSQLSEGSAKPQSSGLKLIKFLPPSSDDEVSEESAHSNREHEVQDSPRSCVIPPPCKPPRSWDLIQSGVIDNPKGCEPRRRSLLALGSLRSKRESFTESPSGADSPSPHLGQGDADQWIMSQSFVAGSPAGKSKSNSLGCAQISGGGDSNVLSKDSLKGSDSDSDWDSDDSLPLDNLAPSAPPGDAATAVQDSLAPPAAPGETVVAVPALLAPEDATNAEKRGRVLLRASSIDLTDSECDPSRDKSNSLSLPRKSVVDDEAVKTQTVASGGGTMGRDGTLMGYEEVWEANAHISIQSGPTSNVSDAHLSIREEMEEAEARSARDTLVAPYMEDKLVFPSPRPDQRPKLEEQSDARLKRESRSLDGLDDKVHDPGGTSEIRTRKHSRQQSISMLSWSKSEEIYQKPPPTNLERMIADNKRINKQLECYDEALRELAQVSFIKKQSSLPLPQKRDMSDPCVTRYAGARNQRYLSLPRTNELIDEAFKEMGQSSVTMKRGSLSLPRTATPRDMAEHADPVPPPRRKKSFRSRRRAESEGEAFGTRLKDHINRSRSFDVKLQSSNKTIGSETSLPKTPGLPGKLGSRDVVDSPSGSETPCSDVSNTSIKDAGAEKPIRKKRKILLAMRCFRGRHQESLNGSTTSEVSVQESFDEPPFWMSTDKGNGILERQSTVIERPDFNVHEMSTRPVTPVIVEPVMEEETMQLEQEEEEERLQEKQEKEEEKVQYEKTDHEEQNKQATGSKVATQEQQTIEGKVTTWEEQTTGNKLVKLEEKSPVYKLLTPEEQTTGSKVMIMWDDQITGNQVIIQEEETTVDKVIVLEDQSTGQVITQEIQMKGGKVITQKKQMTGGKVITQEKQMAGGKVITREDQIIVGQVITREDQIIVGQVIIHEDQITGDKVAKREEQRGMDQPRHIELEEEEQVRPIGGSSTPELVMEEEEGAIIEFSAAEPVEIIIPEPQVTSICLFVSESEPPSSHPSCEGLQRTDSVSDGESDATPQHQLPSESRHSVLKEHLRTATAERGRLEETAAQLGERAERLKYDLAEAREATRSRDEVIALLQGELGRLEDSYTRLMDESQRYRLRLANLDQELRHLKDLCCKYEEEKAQLREAIRIKDVERSNLDQILATRDEVHQQELTAHVKQLEQEKASSLEELTRLDRRIQELETSLSEFRECNKVLSEENARLGISMLQMDSEHSQKITSDGQKTRAGSARTSTKDQSCSGNLHALILHLENMEKKSKDSTDWMLVKDEVSRSVLSLKEEYKTMETALSDHNHQLENIAKKLQCEFDLSQMGSSEQRASVVSGSSKQDSSRVSIVEDCDHKEESDVGMEKVITQVYPINASVELSRDLETAHDPSIELSSAPPQIYQKPSPIEVRVIEASPSHELPKQDSVERTFNSVHSKLLHGQELLKGLQDSVKNLQKVNCCLEQQLEGLKKKVSNYEEELRIVNEKLRRSYEMEVTFQETTAALDLARSENDKLRAQVEELLNQLEDANLAEEQTTTPVGDTIIKLMHENENLKQQLHILLQENNDLAKLRVQEIDMQPSVETLIDENEYLKTDLKERDKLYEDILNDKSRLLKENERLQTEVMELRESLDTLDGTEYGNTLDKFKQENVELKAQLMVAKERLQHESSRARKVTESRYTQTDEMLESLAKDNLNLRAELDEVKQEMLNMDKQLENLVGMRESGVTMNTWGSQEKPDQDGGSQESDEIRSAKIKVVELSNVLGSLRRENSELSTQLRSVQEEKEELEAAVQRLGSPPTQKNRFHPERCVDYDTGYIAPHGQQQDKDGVQHDPETDCCTNLNMYLPRNSRTNTLNNQQYVKKNGKRSSTNMTSVCTETEVECSNLNSSQQYIPKNGKGVATTMATETEIAGLNLNSSQQSVPKGSRGASNVPSNIQYYVQHVRMEPNRNNEALNSQQSVPKNGRSIGGNASPSMECCVQHIGTDVKSDHSELFLTNNHKTVTDNEPIKHDRYVHPGSVEIEFCCSAFDSVYKQNASKNKGFVVDSKHSCEYVKAVDSESESSCKDLGKSSDCGVDRDIRPKCPVPDYEIGVGKRNQRSELDKKKIEVKRNTSDIINYTMHSGEVKPKKSRDCFNILVMPDQCIYLKENFQEEPKEKVSLQYPNDGMSDLKQLIDLSNQTPVRLPPPERKRPSPRLSRDAATNTTSSIELQQELQAEREKTRRNQQSIKRLKTELQLLKARVVDNRNLIVHSSSGSSVATSPKRRDQTLTDFQRQVAELEQKVRDENARRFSLEVQVNKMRYELQEKFHLEHELGALRTRLEKDFVSRMELEQVRKHYEASLVKARQEAEASARDELSTRLRQINTLIEKQVQEQSHQRSSNEAQMRQHFQDTRLKLLSELSKVQATLQEKGEREKELRQRCERLARECERKQELRRKKLVDKAYNVNLAPLPNSREKDVPTKGKLDIRSPLPLSPPDMWPDDNPFSHILRRELERSIRRHSRTDAMAEQPSTSLPPSASEEHLEILKKKYFLH